MYQNLAAGGKKKKIEMFLYITKYFAFALVSCKCKQCQILLHFFRILEHCVRQIELLAGKKKQCPSFTEFFNRKVMQYVLLSSSHCLCSVRCVWKFPSTKKVLIRFLKFFLPLCARLFLSNSYVISISKRTCQKRHIKVTLVCSSRFQTLKMQVAIVVQLKKVFEKNLNLSSIYQRRFSKSFF